MADKRLEIRIDSELLERVDLWTEGRTDVDNRSEAIRKLIEIGLQGIQPEDEEVRLSKGEELILRLLAERWCEEKGLLENSKYGMDPEALFDALVHGQYWAMRTIPIKPVLLHEHTPTKNEVNFVREVLQMWASMIETYNQCTKKQKKEIAKATDWTYIRFPGFCWYDHVDYKFYECMRYIIKHNIYALRNQLYPEGVDLENSKVFDTMYGHTSVYKEMLAVYKKQIKSEDSWTEEKKIKDLIELIQTYQDYSPHFS